MQCDICGKTSNDDSTTCSTCNPYAVDMDAISYVSAPLDMQAKIQQSLEGRDSTSSVKEPSPEKSAQAPRRQDVKIVWIVSLLLLVIGAGILSFFALQLTQKTFLTISSDLIKTGDQIKELETTDKKNPYPPHKGTLVIDDPLRDNSMGNMWMADTPDMEGYQDSRCSFEENGYHLIMSTTDYYAIYCPALAKEPANFAYEVEMTIFAGDLAGIIFRQATGARFYYFVIGHNGTYVVGWSEGDEGLVLKDGSSLDIHRRTGKPNVIAVVANGSNLDFYVNQQLIESVVDSKYQSGRLGMMLISENGGRGNVHYKNARVWTWD